MQPGWSLISIEQDSDRARTWQSDDCANAVLGSRGASYAQFAQTDTLSHAKLLSINSGSEGIAEPLRLHFFDKPNSTSRRMASGRVRCGSFCFAIQESIAAN
jgi:hypothetical protein